MTIGLGGEVGEVHEEAVLVEEGKQDLSDIKLEIGDAMHYATIIGITFGIAAEPRPSGDIQLAANTGKVLEPIKKFIRDGKDPTEKLRAALPVVLGELEMIAGVYDINPDAVRAANVAKLQERYASGRFAQGQAVAA